VTSAPPQRGFPARPRLRERLREPRFLRRSLAFCAVAASLVAIVLLPSFLQAPPWREDALDRARQTGVIRIGYAVEAPFAFLVNQTNVTGESPEIARIITRRLGIPRIEWRLAEFGSLLPGLEARRFDVVAAGLFITPRRARRVAFSRPTFHVGSALLVRQSTNPPPPAAPPPPRSYLDLIRDPQTRVAVLSKSVEEEHLTTLGMPRNRLVRVPDADTGKALVQAGNVTALALSAPTVRWMAAQPSLLRLEAVPIEPDPTTAPASPPEGVGAFAFRTEDRLLREAWDRELMNFLGTDEHLGLIRTFGFTPSELPPAVDTRADIRTPR
jgi:polar amino acid transport system substrate-binding protein